VMEVVEPSLIQVTRGLHTSESAVNEPADEVVRLLSVCDAGEAAVLALEEHARVRQDCRQKPGLTLGEPERLKASGAPATTSRKLRRLTRSPQQLLGQSWMKSASATPSAR